MIKETAPLTVADRAESLNTLDCYCQREIWCASSATRDALMAVAAAVPTGSRVQNLIDAKQARSQKVQELFAGLHDLDKEVLNGIRAPDTSITSDQVSDQYTHVFDVCFGRMPDTEEQKALRTLAHQAYTFLLPVRTAARTIRSAHLRHPKRTELPSFDDLLTRVRAKKNAKPQQKNS